VDFAQKMPWLFVFLLNPSQKTKTSPWLSVRTVQPLWPVRSEKLPDADALFFTRICFCQTSPPSVDRATISAFAFEPTLGPPL